MDKFISSFIIKHLKYSLRFAMVSLVLLIINKSYFISYFVGYIVGILSFILLTMGTNLILNIKPKRVKTVQFIFFTLRIILVAYILARATLNGYNVFVLFIGFLTMNISIRLNTLLKCRKEVSNG
ncbi:MAG: hypothetical protein N2594_05845 [Clostridiales bacterium]|nr:hypothetical protein [Clostridiales bacterium]